MKFALKITGIDVYQVNLPFLALFHSNAHGSGALAAEPTFIEVHTDAGVKGVGEGAPPPPELLTDENPFHLERIRTKLGGHRSWAPVEMACLDIQGKVLDQPLCKLLHGEDIKPRVAHSAYCFFRTPNREGENGVTPENYVEYCQELIRQFGFQCLKLKMGTYPPEVEVELVHQVRRAVGERIALRMDLNGAWSFSSALQAIRKLEDCGMEYLEDPLTQYRGYDYRGMHLLRQRTLIPIAADGHYTPSRLVELVRCDAADVVLGDITGAGGIQAAMRFYRMAQAFDLGLSMHSGYECGVRIAARAQVAAAFPGLHHPIDMHYHHLVDDVIAGGMHKIEEGCITVGDKPGLGVELDPEKLEKYRWTPEKHEENQRIRAELIERYQVVPADTWRPDLGSYPYY